MVSFGLSGDRSADLSNLIAYLAGSCAESFSCGSALNDCNFEHFNQLMPHKLLVNPYYLKQNPESTLLTSRISLNFASHFGVFSKAPEQP